jgi:thioredoxin reductase (NADPH)
MSTPENTYDVIIIGSGPAGNTSAIYLTRAGLKTVMVTGYEEGGQLITTTKVENYPGFPDGIDGPELMEKMLQQCKNLNVPMIKENVTKVDFSKIPYACNLTNDKVIYGKYIVISTGAKAKYLGHPNEKKFLGKGVSGCATCDGFFFKKKKVAVVGGGNTAAIEALHLANFASEVYIIYRKDSFSRMEKSMVDRINANKKITSIFNSEVTDFIGEKKLEKIKVYNNKTKETKDMDMNGCFIAIGKEPQTEIFKGTPLELDGKGYIKTKPDSCLTSVKNVYACGDVANKMVKQAVFAAGQGCLAAIEIQESFHK